MERLGAIGFSAIILGTMPAFGQTGNSLEGRWFGALKADNGDRHCWLSDRRSDGTYRSDFLTENAGMFERYTESGRWAQSPTTFVTLVETKNDAQITPRRLEYGIVELTQDRLIYRHIQSGTQFTTQRVGGEFQIPEHCGIR